LKVYHDTKSLTILKPNHETLLPKKEVGITALHLESFSGMNNEQLEIKDRELNGFTRKIASMLEAIDKSSRKELGLFEIAAHLKEFHVALNGATIQLSALGSNHPHLDEFKHQLRDHKVNLKALRDEYDRKKSSVTKSELLADRKVRDEKDDPESAEGLMQYGLSTQEKSKAVLKNTLKTIHDTIEVGVDTMAKLEANKAQIEGMYDKLESIESTLTRSTRMLKRLARKIATDKYVWVMVALVFTAIVFIIVWKNVKKP